jgi:hypothetical protein
VFVEPRDLEFHDFAQQRSALNVVVFFSCEHDGGWELFTVLEDLGVEQDAGQATAVTPLSFT